MRFFRIAGLACGDICRNGTRFLSYRVWSRKSSVSASCLPVPIESRISRGRSLVSGQSSLLSLTATRTGLLWYSAPSMYSSFVRGLLKGLKNVGAAEVARALEDVSRSSYKLMTALFNSRFPDLDIVIWVVRPNQLVMDCKFVSSHRSLEVQAYFSHLRCGCSL